MTVLKILTEANPARRAASLSLLNFFWAAGAVGGPLLLLLLRNLDRFLALLSLALALCILLAVLSPVSTSPLGLQEASTDRMRRGRLAIAAFLSVAFFLLVGSENAVSGWASSLALPQFSSAYTAAAAPAAFWTFFLIGRASSPSVLRKIEEVRLLSCGLACALVGIVAFFIVQNPIFILIACALAGLGIAPGVPVVIAQVAEKLGDHTPASTVCFAAGGIGAATLPGLVGIIEAKTGIPKLGLAIPLMALAIVSLATLNLGPSHERATGKVVRD